MVSVLRGEAGVADEAMAIARAPSGAWTRLPQERRVTAPLVTGYDGRKAPVLPPKKMATVLVVWPGILAGWVTKQGPHMQMRPFPVAAFNRTWPNYRAVDGCFAWGANLLQANNQIARDQFPEENFTLCSGLANCAGFQACGHALPLMTGKLTVAAPHSLRRST